MSPMVLSSAQMKAALWGITVACLLYLFRDGYESMAQLWSTSETYAHGYVVPLISMWLVWRSRHQWAGTTSKGSLLAVMFMLPILIAWLLGELVSVNVVVHLALIALLVLTVPAIWGWSMASHLMFPLGFLFFAAPVGDFMLPWLMERTADFTVLALRLTGIPVYREGLQFVIPSGNWSVVEACSGIRYIIASLMVGCLFAYLSYRSLRKRWLFMLVALLVPLLANWIRAYLIVMIGHLSGNELATGVDHLIYGWVFFGIVIMAMLYIGARWADPVEPDLTVAAPSSSSSLGAAGSRALWWPAAAAILTLITPHLVLRNLQASVNPAQAVVTSVVASAPWQAQPQPASAWVPAFKNPSAESKQGFIGAGRHTVDLGISYYRQQSRDRKLVSSSNALVGSKDDHWALVQSGSHGVDLSGQRLLVQTATLRARSASITFSGTRLRVWHFYWVGNNFTASDVRAKLQGALQLLRGQGDDAAIVVLSTPLNESLPENERAAAADQVLTSFLQAQAAPLQAALQTTQLVR